MSKELKTGIISVAIIVLFVWGYNYLKGQNVLSPNARHYFVKYTNINGLNEASFVNINGLKVGKVSSINFIQEGVEKGNLLVKFSLDTDFQFSKKSLVKLQSSPLGGTSLTIEPNYEGEAAVSGDYLQGKIEADLFSSVSEKFNPLQTKLLSVLTKADSLLLGFNSVLNKKSTESLNRSILGIEGTLNNVSKTISSLNGVLANNKDNIEATLGNAKRISDNFSKVSKELAEADVAKAVKQLEGTLTNVNTLLGNIKSGKGTLGKLATDEKMYNNLTNASKELEELLREMKLNPKRFVHFSLFGKKPKSYNETNNNKNVSNQ